MSSIITFIKKVVTIMSKTAWVISYKPKKNVLLKKFITATKKLHDEVISRAKGFISWKQYIQDNVRTGFVVWKSLEDANNGTKVG